MEANVSLGIFDMGEFNYLSPSLSTKISVTGEQILITLSKRRGTSDLSNTK